MIKYANRTKLKAGDYQILSYVLEIKPDQFISFDKKLQASYNNYVSSKKI